MKKIMYTGEFPKQLKITRVKPLFRKGHPSSFANYRPNSLLLSISKNFEHAISSQPIDYFTLNTTNIFSSQLSSFRPGN